MNRERLKGIITGAALAAAFFSLATVAAAANIRKTIEIAYRDIAIYVDGEKIAPKDATGAAVEPFIYNGTTFIPVRAAASALGKQVEWDAAANAVYIGTRPEQTGFSKSHPASKGESQNVSLVAAGVKGEATVLLSEVLRGDAAMRTLHDANRTTAAPKDGFEYILARFSVSIKDLSEGSVNVNSSLFSMYSGKDVRYTESAPVIAPSPQLSGQLSKGASVEGWVVFQVAKDDAAPKCAFAVAADGIGGAWFTLA